MRTGASMSGPDPVPVRPVNAAALPRLGWAEGLTFALPAALAKEWGLLSRLDAAGRLDLSAGPPPLPPDAAGRLRLHAAFIDRDRLPKGSFFAYSFIPRRLRCEIAKFLGRRNRPIVYDPGLFPAWPLDLCADFVADLAGQEPEPLPGPAPVLLTHDLDTPEGLRNLVRRVLPLEERLGARSVNFVVPLGFALDHGLLGEVVSRGHEIGMHGFDHRGRTPFLPAPEIGRRLDAGRAALERYAPRGYRAPSLLRTPALLTELGKRFAFDSSLPNSGGVFPYPGNGCPTARPFPLAGLTELPITVPRDVAQRFMGYSPKEILGFWLDSLARIRAAGGVAVVLTHPEPYYSGGRDMLEAYARLLDRIGGDAGFCFAAPAELCPERPPG